MKRNYISPEYIYSKVNGTFNTLEQSSFLGSKMLQIEDSLVSNNKNVIYYQNSNHEQLDLGLESLLPSIVYSCSDDKNLNHTLLPDKAQTSSQRDGHTRWILNIDLKTILSNYIFALLKQARTFEGVRTTMTYNNDVDFFIKEYTYRNVSKLYKVSKVELFLKYNNIITHQNLKFQTTWNNTIGLDQYKMPKIETKTSFDYSTIQVVFSQQNLSTEYNFDYFFNIYWNRI